VMRHLAGQDAINQLILTPVFQSIVEAGPLWSERVLNTMLNSELEARRVGLQGAIDELRGQLARWSTRRNLAVFDTTVFVHHKEKVEEIDFSEVLGLGGRVLLLVPIVVIDELDRLKESKTTHVRWRARHTLSVIARCVDSSLGGRLRRREMAGQAMHDEVSVEIILDPPGHVRLSIADDEIIDRSATIHRIAGHPVHLVTYDTGMEMRARPTGLTVCKREQPETAEDRPPL
jgi:rRNA-processing protein FCF1